MEKLTLSIPSMWADHHVLAVREALSQVEGVQDVLASAMYRDVLVTFDPTTVSSDALKGALASEGYSIGTAPDLPSHPERIDDTSDWFQFQERVTVTDYRDLEMSGDHRKY